MARVDITILREIVRVIEALAKVPDYVTVSKRRFHLTYLEDHRQRIEEALRRHDRNQLNMLFGQLASKVKYQALRMASVATGVEPTPEPAGGSKPKPAIGARAPKSKTAAAKKVVAKTSAKTSSPKTSAKKPAAASASKKKK